MTLRLVVLLSGLIAVMLGCHSLPAKEGPREPPICLGDPGDCPLACADDCARPNAVAACRDGACLIERCYPGWADADGDAANGCERVCARPTAEQCDGQDNDCDGAVDEAVDAPIAPGLRGVCAGARRVCAGAAGFGEPRVEGIAGFEADEWSCDGLDNDCDGVVDEGMSVGEPCVAGFAACAVEGSIVCAEGAPVCDATPRRPRAVFDDTCDLVDDDCDGKLDEDPPCNGPACSRLGGVPPGYICLGPGTFRMGSPPDERDRRPDEPWHRVTLTRTVLMAETELTQAQWEAVPGFSNPSIQTDGGDRPVERVSQFDAMRWLNARSLIDGLTPCYALIDCEPEPPEVCPPDSAIDWCFGPGCAEVRWFASCDGWRLATEAEWEYAVRGGTETAYWCGAEVSCLDPVEWHSSNRPRNNPHFVGILPANTRGLHDMAGNVAEWVFDHHHPGYGETVAPLDPIFRDGSAGADVVLRGGSANDLAVRARSAGRRALPPTFRDFATGFRPVRTIDP